MVTAPAIVWPSVPMTIRTADVVTEGISSHAAAADGSTTTTVGLMTRSSPSISGAGLVGFRGAMMAPIPIAAKYQTPK